MSLASRVGGLFKSQSLKNVAVLVSGTGAAQIIAFLATPALTRIYDKEELGLFSVFNSAFLMLVGAACLRFEQGIPLQEKESDAQDLLRLSFAAVLGFSLILLIASLLFGSQFGALVQAPIFGQYPWLLPLALALGGIYQAGSSWCIRTHDFKTIARTTFSQSLVMTLAQLGLPFLIGKTSFSLSSGLALGRVAGISQIYRGVKVFPQDGWGPAWKRMVGQAKLNRKFAYYAAPAAIANAAGLMLPPVLLSKSYGPGEAALFFLSVKVLGAPMTFLGQAISQVYTAEASRLIKVGPHGLPNLFRATLKRLAAPIALLAAIGLSAPLWFGPVFGANFAESGIWTAILVPTYCLSLACSPISLTASLTGRQALQLWLDLLRLVLVFLSISVPAYLKWAPMQAIILYAVLMVVTYVIYLFCYWGCAVAASKRPPLQEPEAE